MKDSYKSAISLLSTFLLVVIIVISPIALVTSGIALIVLGYNATGVIFIIIYVAIITVIYNLLD